MKGNLRIQRFCGTSGDAVKSQIRTAVAVYALVAIIRKEPGISMSLHDMLEIQSVRPFEQVPLHEVLTSPDRTPAAGSAPQQLPVFEA